MPYWWLIFPLNTPKSVNDKIQWSRSNEKGGHIYVSENVLERDMYEWTHFGCANSDVNNDVEAPEHNPNSIDQDESRVVY